MSTSSVTRYHPALVALHWGLAALIIADLSIGALVLVHIPNHDPMKIEGLRAHMGAGIAILALMLVRLAVRIGATAPPEAPTGSEQLDRLAWWSHRLIYMAVLGMAASGLALGLQTHLPDVVYFGRGQVPADFWVYPLRGVHYAFSRLLMGLIALHIAGALYHVGIRRDQLLRRMWFGRRAQTSAAIPAAAVAGRSEFWRYAPWLERAILVAPTLLFTVIGWKYLSRPIEIAAGSQIVLGSPAAITDTRAQGAVFIALAAITLISLLSTRRLLAGLSLVAVVVGFVTGARILGALVDGAAAETMLKLVPEVVLLTLATVGILIELARQRLAQRS